MFNFFDDLKKQFNLSEEFASYKLINLSGKLLYVEGLKALLNLSPQIITFKVKSGVVTVEGNNLQIKHISDTTLSIAGNIKNIEVL